MKKTQMTISKEGIIKCKKKVLIADDEIIVNRAKIDAVIERAKVISCFYNIEELIEKLEDLKK